jgi:hypothetical protein
MRRHGLARDDFFVFEPQVNAAADLIPQLAFTVGAGCRLVGFADALDDRLHAATGNVGLQLTW